MARASFVAGAGATSNVEAGQRLGIPAVGTFAHAWVMSFEDEDESFRTYAEAFPEARKPAYKLVIDFGPGVGRKKSSAQITEAYALEDLPGRRVLAVVNFPPRQIGPFMSEVLVLGVHDASGAVRLLGADGEAPDGARVC